ncbi:hypothetical protein [Caldalkalibacillus salinus]|uniref:hypothetical protein n=1 Tax=Caldalkalibacillus salinus TaxID=2803787 RepID=UPI00192394CC|nr:hypothetical protein [Caldalkalibacillus salinus]
MTDHHDYQDAIEAVKHAEVALYEAQTNANPEERQDAIVQLKIARDKVLEAQKNIGPDDDEHQHRLGQAMEQLDHLEAAEQALNN